VATLLARSTNKTIAALVVGLAGLRLARVWSLESGSRFCVHALGRNLALAIVKMFSCLIHLMKEFYEFCTFSAFTKIMNAAISSIIFQHNKSSFLSTLTGYSTPVI
jgi:hypothetical protein